MTELANIGGRLSLESGNPAYPGDLSAKTTIYYTPYLSDHIALWDGSAWQDRATGEISLGVPDPGVGNTLAIDVWAKYVSGAVTLGYTWWGSTSRQSGYGLVTRNGVLVMEDDNEKRYIGSAYVKHDGGAGKVWDTAKLRHLFNLYNRLPRVLQYVMNTASWAGPSSNGWGDANGSADSFVEYFNGAYNALVVLDVEVPYAVDTPRMLAGVKIMKGSTTLSDYVASDGVVSGIGMPAMAHAVDFPEAWGLHTYVWKNRGVSPNNVVYYGSGYKSGLRGFVMN